MRTISRISSVRLSTIALCTPRISASHRSRASDFSSCGLPSGSGNFGISLSQMRSAELGSTSKFFMVVNTMPPFFVIGRSRGMRIAFFM
jgi:hypothetical protein